MSKLKQIIQYQEMARAAGHTKLTLDIAEAAGSGAIVIVANAQEVARLSRKHPSIKFVTINSLDRLYGRYDPLFIDHATLAELLHEHDMEWRKMLGEVIRKAEAIKTTPTTEAKS